MTFFAGLGHSHVVALAKGAYELQMRGATLDGAPIACRFHYLYDAAYEPAFVDSAGDGALNPAIVSALTENNPRFIVASIGGNEHNVLSIAQRDGKFDFILGENPDLPFDESAEPIPEAAVRETLRDWMEDKMAILRAAHALSAAPIVLVEPPPPLPREQVLAYPGEFFRSAFDRRNLSPDVLRHKMWRVQTGLLRELAAEVDAIYVETPADMIDARGMLPRNAWGKDATHANDAYGAAIMTRAFDSVGVRVASGN